MSNGCTAIRPLYSQEIFRQNSLHHVEGEAVAEIWTAIEAAWYFSL